MRLLLIILVLIIQIGDANSTEGEELNKILEKMRGINSDIFSTLDCPNLSPREDKKSCSEITDNFCSRLWSKQNNGNLEVFDGAIKAGKSNKSELSLSVLEDDNALLDSFPRLSEDAQKAFAPIFAELKKTLSEEKDEAKWYRKRSAIKLQLKNAIDDLIDERIEKEKEKPENSNLSKIEKGLLDVRVHDDLHDEITLAKYKTHPNWQRVEKIFPLVKENLIASIGKLKISEERKKIMLEKIRSINLSLPLQNKNTVMADESCATTTVNAYYLSSTNQFTVCAGFFNQYQSNSAIVFILTHEMGHSIDSENIAKMEWRQKSEVAKSLNKLKNSKGPVYSCSEWEKEKETTLKPMENFSLKNLDPLEKVYSCIANAPELEEMSKPRISHAAKTITAELMNEYANSNFFSKLVQKEEKNEVYLRPDKALEKMDGYNDKDQTRDVDPIELFNQSFNCLLEKNKIDENQFQEINPNLKIKIFEDAMKETAELMQLRFEDYFQYCGKNCSQLVRYGLSANTKEGTSDWFASRAFPDFLKSISPDKRGESSALSTSLFCDSAGTSNSNSELLITSEKKYSLEPHPDDSSRRTSLYIPETAKLLNCEIKKSLNEQEKPLCEL